MSSHDQTFIWLVIYGFHRDLPWKRVLHIACFISRAIGTSWPDLGGRHPRRTTRPAQPAAEDQAEVLAGRGNHAFGPRSVQRSTPLGRLSQFERSHGTIYTYISLYFYILVPEESISKKPQKPRYGVASDSPFDRPQVLLIDQAVCGSQESMRMS